MQQCLQNLFLNHRGVPKEWFYHCQSDHNYKSYIQKILDEYDTTDYQVIRVEEFTELLEIRDTIRQPIFMYENADKTSTKFFVVTCLKTIYSYEIKVEDEENAYNTHKSGGSY